MEESGTFFRKHGMVFHHLWLNLVTFPEPPHVVTSDGDPLMFCRSVFDTERAAVAVALSNSFGFGGTNCSLVFGRPA